MLKGKPRKTFGLLRGKGLITNLQRKILLSFVRIADVQHFYLTGGTALAEFYLGHRLSYDLNCKN